MSVTQLSERKKEKMFDPKEFAKQHGFKHASLTWYGHFGTYYEVTAWGDNVSANGCTSRDGDTPEAAAEAVLSAITAYRALTAVQVENERRARIERLEREISTLKDAAPARNSMAEGE